MTINATELLERVRRETNVLLYGPPGTGKSFLMQEVARLFADEAIAPITINTTEERKPLATAAPPSRFTRWVTFHQSYGYEDFVIGLRPDPSATTGLGLKAQPGVLVELATLVRETNGEALLLIDEINRGNAARIFGEFITLLEPEKRLAVDGSATTDTVTVRLPYVRDDLPASVSFESNGAQVTVNVPTPFTLPRSIYVLASMNSVDKSVAPLDAALRRRFHVVDLTPEPGKLLLTQFSPDGAVADVQKITDAALAAINTGIAQFLGPDYEFGPWYMKRLVAAKNDSEAKQAAADVFRSVILPQLMEWFATQPDQLVAVIGSAALENGPLGYVPPTADQAELGAAGYFYLRPSNDDVLISWLRLLGKAGAASATPSAEARTASGASAEGAGSATPSAEARTASGASAEGAGSATPSAEARTATDRGDADSGA